MTHNWKIKKQNFFCLQSKNFPPDKRHPGHNTAEKRLRMRGNKKDGEEFKCKIINKNMAI
jgi:hypothetical protein